MIEIHAPQGSPEWKKARAGVITASNFKLARSRTGGLTEQQASYVHAVRVLGFSEKAASEHAGYKTTVKPTANVLRALNGLPVGEASDGAKALAFRLAVERISGEPLDEGFETWAMTRGHELEPEARAAHEDRVGDMVEEVGFILTDDRLFGASADGFRARRAIGCEYKCFINPDKLRAILLDDDLSDVTDQVQGGIWIADTQSWDFGLYCPALKSIGLDFTLIPVKRDDDFIADQQAELMEFARLVERYEQGLRSKGLGTHTVTSLPPANTAAKAAAEAADEAATPATPYDIPETIFA